MSKTNFAFNGTIPADPLKPGYSIYGSKLNRLGRGQRNMKVYGYYCDFDGVMYGKIAEDVVLPGDFKIEILHAGLVPGGTFLYGGAWNADLGLSDECYISIGESGTIVVTMTEIGQATRLYASSVLADTSAGILVLQRVNNTITISNNASIATINDIYKYDFKFSKLGRISTTVARSVKCIDANNILIHDWAFDGSPDIDQPVFYDRVGNNHCTMVNAPTRPCTALIEGSTLLTNGYTEGELIHTELIANWDFSAGLTDWTFQQNAYASVADGILELFSASGQYAGLYSADTLIADVRYYAVVVANIPAGLSLRLHTYLYGDLLIEGTGEMETYYITFTTSGNNIHFYPQSPGTYYIDSISVKEFPIGIIPANLSTGLSALGQPLTSKPGQIFGVPYEFEAVSNIKWREADAEHEIFFDTNGTPKKLTSASFDNWPLGYTKDQYFYNGTKGIITLWQDGLVDQKLSRAIKYFNLTERELLSYDVVLSTAGSYTVGLSVHSGESCTVHWGDGSTTDVTYSASDYADQTHTYASAGTYTITIVRSEKLRGFRHVSTTNGDIAFNLDCLPNATYVAISGSNTVSGDLSGIPNATTVSIYGSNTVSDYTAGVIWPSSMRRVYIAQAAGSGFSSSEVDSLLIDLAASVTTWTSEKSIYLAGNNASRTSASDAAVATLISRGVTVTTN